VFGSFPRPVLVIQDEERELSMYNNVIATVVRALDAAGLTPPAVS
jgi:hypothetical protein